MGFPAGLFLFAFTVLGVGHSAGAQRHSLGFTQQALKALSYFIYKNTTSGRQCQQAKVTSLAARKHTPEGGGSGQKM